jgi:excisionase family DNA binding protein
MRGDDHAAALNAATAKLAEALSDVLAVVASAGRQGGPVAGGTGSPTNVGALNRAAAARYLGIGTTKLAQLTRDGRLPSVRIGDRRLWRRSDLDAFLAGLPNEARPE